MALSPVWLRYSSQPPLSYLDNSYPSARGLIGLYNPRVGPWDLSGNNNHLTNVGAATLVPGNQGIGFKPATSSYFATPDLSGLITSTTGVTLMMLLQSGTTANQGLMRAGSDTTNLDHYPYSNNIYSSAFASTRWVPATASSVTLTSPHIATFRHNGLSGINSHTFRQNGKTVYSNGSPITFGLPSDGKIWLGSSFTTGSSWYYSGSIACVAVWNRFLPDQEESALSSSLTGMWKLFAPQPRRIWVPSAGGASAYSDSISESLTFIDAAAVAAAFFAASADSAAITDALAAATAFQSAVDNSLTGADVTDGSVGSAQSLSASLTLTDVAAALAAFAAASAEAGALTDAQTSLAGFSAADAESLTAADAQDYAGAATAAAAESVTLTDQSTAVAAFTAAITESGTPTDLASAAAAFLAAATGSLTATDASDWFAGQFGSAAESATLTDAIQALAALSAASAESVAASDVAVAVAAFVAGIVDAFAAVDAQTGTTTGALSLTQSDIDAIASAVWQYAARALTAQVDANVVSLNGAQVIGTGTEGDDWRGVGVQP